MLIRLLGAGAGGISLFQLGRAFRTAPVQQRFPRTRKGKHQPWRSKVSPLPLPSPDALFARSGEGRDAPALARRSRRARRDGERRRRKRKRRGAAKNTALCRGSAPGRAALRSERAAVRGAGSAAGMLGPLLGSAGSGCLLLGECPPAAISRQGRAIATSSRQPASGGGWLRGWGCAVGARPGALLHPSPK